VSASSDAVTSSMLVKPDGLTTIAPSPSPPDTGRHPLSAHARRLAPAPCGGGGDVSPRSRRLDGRKTSRAVGSRRSVS